MKKLLLAFCLVFVIFIQPTFAFTIESKDILDINEEINDDLYAAGQTMNVNKDILGDLLFAGQMINFNSIVKGDLMGAGQMINISNDVEDDVRIAGQKIDISSKINGDAIVFGQIISTTKDSEINGDAMIYGQALNLMGNIGGKAKLAGNTVNIMGEIKGDVDITSESNVNFGSSGMILGNLNLKAPVNVDKKYVKGEIKYEKYSGEKEETESNVAKNIFGVLTILQIIDFVLSLILGIILIFLFKNYLKAVSKEARNNVFMSFCMGLCILVALPILCIVILSTVIGAPIAGIIFFVYLAMIILATILDAFVVGNLIIPFDGSTGVGKVIGSFALGSLIMFAIGFIPFVGWFINFIIFLIALGALGKVHWDNLKMFKGE